MPRPIYDIIGGIMLQEKQRDCHSHTYLHLLTIVIEGYLGMIEALQKIYKEGYCNKEYGYEYVEHTGCCFTVIRILESKEIDNKTKNKILLLRDKYFEASELEQTLNSPREIQQKFPLVLSKFIKIYQEYVTLFLEELKRKKYYDQIVSLNKQDLDTYISFLLDRSHSKETHDELVSVFKKILNKYIFKQAA